MATTNDGGAAFPVRGEASGMILRDWFAGQALARGVGLGLYPDDQAEACYKVADAMLAARAKGGDA